MATKDSETNSDNIRFLFNEKEIIADSGHSAGLFAELTILPVEADKLYCYWDFLFQEQLNDNLRETDPGSKAGRKFQAINVLPIIKIYQLLSKKRSNGEAASNIRFVGSYQTIPGKDSIYIDVDWQDGLFFGEIGFADQENNFYSVAGSNTIGKLPPSQAEMLIHENENGQPVTVADRLRQVSQVENESQSYQPCLSVMKYIPSIVTKECEDKYNEGNYSSHSNK